MLIRYSNSHLSNEEAKVWGCQVIYLVCRELANYGAKRALLFFKQLFIPGKLVL